MKRKIIFSGFFLMMFIVVLTFAQQSGMTGSSLNGTWLADEDADRELILTLNNGNLEMGTSFRGTYTYTGGNIMCV